MEGLQAVELNLNELESGIRIDAELYKKDLVLFEKRMKMAKYTLLGTEVKLIKKGIFDIKSDCYTDKGVPFVRISNLKNQVIDMSNIVYIPESENIKNLNTALVRNDIILSKTANAAASLVNIQLCNTSQDTVAIKLKEDSLVNSHFVVTYLNTSYGLKQMQRWFTGNIQMHLNLEDCKNNLLIPIYSALFQNKIKELFENSISKSSISQTTYTQAETFLLQEIGLQNFTPSKEPVNIKSFKESFGVTARLDAEYYQMKYEEIEIQIKKNVECEILSNIMLRIETGEYSPEYFNKNDKLDNLTFYIRSTNIKGGRIELDDNYYVEKTNFNRIAKTGEIVTARVGSVGVFGEVRPELAGSVYSDNVLCFTLPNYLIPSVYTLLFNSKYYFEFIDRLARGSVQQRLNQETLKDLIIPIIDFKKQKQIAELVEESFKLKSESERLLEVAKKAVEMAIEEGEKKAMEYIKIKEYGN